MLDTHHLESLDNNDLLAAYQNTEPRAFDIFFKRNSKLIYNFLLLRLQNPGDAEDAMQETFCRVHRFILSYDPEQNAMGWIFAIARNVIVNVFKKRSKAQVEIRDDMASVPANQYVVEARDEVMKLLEQLNEKDRELIVSRYMMGDSFEDIAEAQGLKVDNTRQRISRLIRRLRASSLK